MLRIKPLVTVAAVLASLSALQFRAAADEIPERRGELSLMQELGYQLPLSGAQRRLAIYRHD